MFDLKFVENSILKSLNHKWITSTFTRECDLFYKGQIPTGAIYIIEGKVGLVKRNKVATLLKPGQVLLLEELLNEKELKHTVRVFPGSKIILIDRFSILEEVQEIA